MLRFEIVNLDLLPSLAVHMDHSHKKLNGQISTEVKRAVRYEVFLKDIAKEQKLLYLEQPFAANKYDASYAYDELYDSDLKDS